MSTSNLHRNSPIGAPAGTGAFNPSAELQRGVALHQAGNLEAAEPIYRAILQRLPKQADALQLLGVVHHQRGDHARAVDLIRRSLKIDDRNPHALINLGAAQQALGRLEEAEKTYADALQRLPDHPELLANYAAVLKARGNRLDAIAALDRAVALRPAQLPWRTRLGDLLMDEHCFDAAVPVFEGYLALAPDDMRARNDLGVALEKLGRHEAAAVQLRIVIERQPDLAEAHANLGNACVGLRQFDEAEACYRRAIELDSAKWRFRINLANLLFDSGRGDEARTLCEAGITQQADDANLLNELAGRQIKAKRAAEAIDVLRRAIEIEPGFAGAHNNLGNAFVQLKRYGEAKAAFEESIRVAPDFLLPRLNLCGLLQKVHHWDDAVLQSYGMRMCKNYAPELCDNRILQIFRDVTDFDGLEAMEGFWDQIETRSREEVASAALTLLAMADDEAKLQRLGALVRRMGNDFAAEARARPLPPPAPRPSLSGRKLRVGILSSDLREHSVAKFVLPVLRHYDRDRFELYCYSTFAEDHDAVQAEMRSLVDRFHSVVDLRDREIAELMRADGIDLLLELNGYTMHSRLPVVTYRPAPVQVAWLGWPFSSGVSEMDYFLVDHFTRPTRADSMVETPLEMDGAFVCFESFKEEPLVPPPFLKNGHITFGTLNAVYKWTRPMVARWCDVMRAVEGSRMVIVRPEARSLVFLGNIVKEFERNGISRDRLDIINNRAGAAGHLSYYNLFDISLDTFPVTGGTTTTDALWMGVPVVTRMGDAYHQRISGAILKHCGLDDLCVTNDEDFVRVAVGLATDRDRLVALRQGLRETLRDSPLCRVDKFMAGFQDALLAAAQKHLG